MKPSAVSNLSTQSWPERDAWSSWVREGVVCTKWTPEMDAKLRQARANGLSYGQIATALRVTRNAAIGRGHRLGLATPAPVERVRRSAVARRRATVERRAQAVTRVNVPRLVAPRGWKPAPIQGEQTILTVAEGQCRYIGGASDYVATRDTPVCGAPCDEGHAYCVEHHAVVFQ